MHKRWFIYGGAIAFLALTILIYNHSVWGWAGTPSQQVQITPDVQYHQCTFKHRRAGLTVRLDVVLISPDNKSFDIAILPETDPQQTWEDFIRNSAALVVVNGGYFDASGQEAVGLLLLNGIEVQALSNQAALSGMVCINRDGRVQLRRRSDGYSTTDLQSAIQAGPFLIDPGGAMGIGSDDLKLAKRTAIGITKDGEVALIKAERCTLYQLAEILHSRSEAVGVEQFDAVLNLDGGPSQGMSLHGHFVQSPETEIHNVILAKPLR
ncbi:MAG: phosphodiester glycosidase family protein [Planctomycetota bacterium]